MAVFPSYICENATSIEVARCASVGARLWEQGLPAMGPSLTLSRASLAPTGWESDPLRNLFAAQGFKDRRQEIAEGQHHQGEAGVQLAQGLFAAVFFGLVLQQFFKLQALDDHLVVEHEGQLVLPGQGQLRDLLAGAQVQ